jgi:hypothetical protein
VSTIIRLKSVSPIVSHGRRKVVRLFIVKINGLFITKPQWHTNCSFLSVS